jgi:glutamate-1-semialdehyde 2,1-aminomutase
MRERFATSRALFERALKVTPGGIYGSKAPGFAVPGHFPYYFTHGEGCRVWDADGHEYIDYLCGFGSMILGFGDPAVDEPAIAQLRGGDLHNCPSPVMVDLAERLVALQEGLDWAVFAKNGTDATTLAISLARVHTGKGVVLMAEGAYHGSANWCSVNEYPVLTDKAEVHGFPYGDVQALERLFDRHRGKIAAVILTPFHHPAFADSVLPPQGWYPAVEALCEAEGALFVMDDIRCNFRLSLHGSHAWFGARPHLVAMGKSVANGYPISVLMGTESLAKTAGSFFITGTFWTSAVPMVAAMATLSEMERRGTQEHCLRVGRRLKEGLTQAAAAAGYRVTLSGPDSIPFMTFTDDPDLYHNQLFSVEMVKRGVYLHPHHNWFVSGAHTDADIDETVEKAESAFRVLRENEGGTG